MGFIVNSNYVIQGFPSAEAYFTYLLTNEEVFDARAYLNRYGSIRLFGQVYYELLKKHQIFQFEKDQIITLKRLERLSITPDLVEDYCFSVQEYVDPDSYFTYESLYQAGFSHKLDELGFSEFFYSYLLGIDERFYSQRAFGTTVLYNGKAAGQFSVADFIVSQLREYDSVDLDDFIQDIKDRYGIVIPNRYEVTNTIKGTELYYDDIMDKVYLDKSLYVLSECCKLLTFCKVVLLEKFDDVQSVSNIEYEIYKHLDTLREEVDKMSKAERNSEKKDPGKIRIAKKSIKYLKNTSDALEKAYLKQKLCIHDPVCLPEAQI